MDAQNPITTALASFDAALQAGRLAQAYLVVGNVREEALPFAEEALTRLFCNGILKPCGACPACARIREHKHIDVVWIEPEKKSRVVGIDRIRELQQVIYQTSYSGGWKAVVLVNADRIGEEASNAFLKTLEEPPARSIFFLLTDSPQTILSTILSRCQRIILSTEPERLQEPWFQELIGILSEPMDDTLISRMFRSGNLGALLGRIKKTVEQEEAQRLNEELENRRNPDDKKITKKNLKDEDDVLKARVEARYRAYRSMVLRSMLFWYRDLLVLVCGVEASRLRYPEQADRLAALAARMTYADALANLRVVEVMQRQYDRNTADDLVLPAGVNGLSV
ncbi:MAG: DNA polymerase III subunit [bacterium]